MWIYFFSVSNRRRFGEVNPFATTLASHSVYTIVPGVGRGEISTVVSRPETYECACVGGAPTPRVPAIGTLQPYARATPVRVYDERTIFVFFFCVLSFYFYFSFSLFFPRFFFFFFVSFSSPSFFISPPTCFLSTFD